jgi:serine/threonine-protein kinase
MKPENVFLCTQGGLKDFPKVLDFGLAKVTEREMRPGSIMLTQEGMVFGTPEFMSPEQAQGRTLTPASDIYSLAVILYELLTGKLPFDARTPIEFLQLHVTARPIPLNERTPGRTFDPALADVVGVALQKKPEDRYQSGGQFSAALRPFAPGFQSFTAGASVPAAPGGPPGTAFVPTPAPPPARKGGVGLIVGVAAACLVMGVVLAVAVMRFLR